MCEALICTCAAPCSLLLPCNATDSDNDVDKPYMTGIQWAHTHQWEVHAAALGLLLVHVQRLVLVDQVGDAEEDGRDRLHERDNAHVGAADLRW